MSLFNPSRNEVRDFFFNTWKKYKQQSPLSDLEKISLHVILMHPEYHNILDTPEQFIHQEYFPDSGETNPFLHMSLHLSLLEQIAINQPIGIADIYQQLKIKNDEEHTAQHHVLDCLAETIWLAQQNNTGLNAAYYLQLLQEKVGKNHNDNS
jgi:hypothetical protein